jgi:glutaredoxin 3
MFEVYSKPGCSHCDNAKALLKRKGLEYCEHILDVGQPKVEGVSYYTVPQLHQKVPGAKTVPQIFEGSSLIGGFEALKKHLG